MTEELISFDTAKLAKEKGFNIPTRNFYADFTWKSIEVYSCIEVGYNEFTDSMENNHGFGDITLIPTQSLLQKWLREIHKISVEVTSNWWNEGKSEYEYNIYQKDLGDKSPCSLDVFKTYEEALEVGLQEGLKLIK